MLHWWLPWRLAPALPPLVASTADLIGEVLLYLEFSHLSLLLFQSVLSVAQNMLLAEQRNHSHLQPHASTSSTPQQSILLRFRDAIPWHVNGVSRLRAAAKRWHEGTTREHKKHSIRVLPMSPTLASSPPPVTPARPRNSRTIAGLANPVKHPFKPTSSGHWTSLKSS